MPVPRFVVLAALPCFALAMVGGSLSAQSFQAGALEAPSSSLHRAAPVLFPRPLPATLPLALECDGQAVRAAELKRSRGKKLMIGGAAASVLWYGGVYSGNYGSGLNLLAVASTVGALVGYYWYAHSDDPDAWNQALSGFTVGVSTDEDVRSCLGQPWAVTSNGERETWSYMASRPGYFGGTVQTVQVVLEDEVVVQVETTRVGR